MYIGKCSIPANVPLAAYHSINLTKSIHGTNRNATMDNSFKSNDVVKKFHDHHSVSVGGTLKKNKTEIPETFVQVKKKLCLVICLILLSYCPPKSKQKKIVLLLSIPCTMLIT